MRICIILIFKRVYIHCGRRVITCMYLFCFSSFMSMHLYYFLQTNKNTTVKKFAMIRIYVQHSEE